MDIILVIELGIATLIILFVIVLAIFSLFVERSERMAKRKRAKSIKDSLNNK